MTWMTKVFALSVALMCPCCRSGPTVVHVPPLPPEPVYETRAPQLEVKVTRPRVSQSPTIRSVAVLGFGNKDVDDGVLESLVNFSGWRIMDRATLGRIIAEQDLQHSGRFDDATAVRIGKLSGVQLVLLGEPKGSNGCTLKGIDVETGQYLVYKTVYGETVVISDGTSPSVAESILREATARAIITELVPSAVLIRNGSVFSRLLGGDPARYSTVPDFLAEAETHQPGIGQRAQEPERVRVK